MILFLLLDLIEAIRDYAPIVAMYLLPVFLTVALFALVGIVNMI